MQASVGQGLGFLQMLLSDTETHRGYSTMCTARSALSAVIIMEDGSKFGDHHLVKLFMKGIFNTDPPKPRYIDTWDPEVVLKLLMTWSPAHKLSLGKLTKKVVMLILLVTGQRGQIIKALNTNNMSITATRYKFYVDNLDIKQGRPGYKPEPVVLRKYPANKQLCVYHYMTVYLKRTLDLRGETKDVFITTVKPFKPVSRDTISNWVKDTLSKAGINITKFKPGSTRSASCSKALKQGAPIDEIIKAGGWSTPSTFSKWYARPVKKKTKEFDKCVLD